MKNTMKKISVAAGKVARFIAPVPRSLARVWTMLFVMAVALCASFTASAQTNNFPDPSALYTASQTPFNTALTWSIGATAVLIVIGWIVRAMRKKG